MKLKKIEGVIFDLDGTLVDTIEDIGDAANAMLDHYGLPHHRISEYVQWVGSGVVKFIERALNNACDPDQVQACVATFREIYSRNLHNKSRIFDGVPAVLDELTEKGIRLSVLSNKPDHLTRQVVRHFLSPWPFHPVLGQRDEVPRKPDPAAALEIADLMNLETHRIMFVGDSDNDFDTALAAGMVPVGVTWGYGRKEDDLRQGEVTWIDHPRELLSLIH
ncbi:MAG TPA: HAD family hydrolase [Bacteroides sp.]|nr:HAD family hydrolase [Bacteroides sp.]